MRRKATLAACCATSLVVLLAALQPATTRAQAPSLEGCQILPADNIWNTPIDQLPVDAHSAEYVANIGASTGMHPDFGSAKYGDYGIPFNIVPQNQPLVPVSFTYADESDPGPYPIPSSPNIEAGGDRHILTLVQGSCKLYETWASEPAGDGWLAGSGAVFDLGSNALRTDGKTSADAAGLPILPGLTRYDEVHAGAINHALRFTVPCTANYYIWPARHKAVPDSCPATPPAGTRVPPNGLRFRLKASVNIAGFSDQTRVILTALKKYGMIVADNGTGWYLSGAPDPGWDDDTLVAELRQIHGSDFEVVDESSLQISQDSGQARPPGGERMAVSAGGARQGQAVGYSIQIGGDGAAVGLANQLPTGLTLVAGPSITPNTLPAASYDGASRTISWSGAPAIGVAVAIDYTVTLDSAATGVIVNSATVTRTTGARQVAATLIANPAQRFLPMLRR